MKPTIALDLDGVCYEWDKTARYMLRRKLRQEKRPIPASLFEESTYWSAIQDAVTADDWGWLWNEGVEQGLFRYGHCCRGAIEGAQELAKLGKIIIVTARPTSAVSDTLAWLAFMFDEVPLAGVHFTSDKASVPADLYVDDAPQNVEALRAAGKRVIPVKQPWNDFADGARDWPHIVDMARAILLGTAEVAA